MVGGGLFAIAVGRATAADKKRSARWLSNSHAVVGASYGSRLEKRQAFLVSNRAANLKLNSTASPLAAGWLLGAALLHIVATDVVEVAVLSRLVVEVGAGTGVSPSGGGNRIVVVGGGSWSGSGVSVVVVGQGNGGPGVGRRLKVLVLSWWRGLAGLVLGGEPFALSVVFASLPPAKIVAFLA